MGGGNVNSIIKGTKKGQMINEYHLTYKAPLIGSRSNRFWKDLKRLAFISAELPEGM